MKVIELCRTLAKMQPDADVFVLDPSSNEFEDFEIRTIKKDIEDELYEPEEIRGMLEEGVIRSINDIYLELI